MYRLQVGTKFSCGERVPWCYDRLVGAFSRTLEFVSSERAATPKLAAMRRVRNATEPVLAVWHIRTGDIKLAMRRQAAEAMKKTIDGSFPRRGVEHVVLTYKRADITSAFPWFAEIGLREIRDSTTLGDEQSFELMLNAGVVVSTGSSFPHAPAGLALPGHQVHLYMAPKTVVKDPKTPHDTRCCLTLPLACRPSACASRPNLCRSSRRATTPAAGLQQGEREQQQQQQQQQQQPECGRRRRVPRRERRQGLGAQSDAGAGGEGGVDIQLPDAHAPVVDGLLHPKEHGAHQLRRPALSRVSAEAAAARGRD